MSGPTNKAGTPEKAKTQFGIDSGDCAEESEPNGKSLIIIWVAVMQPDVQYEKKS